jgi:GNAT superfamily N-acetyltransferase
MGLRLLTVDDLDAVDALYGEVFPSTPLGHLSRYDRAEHREILAGSGVCAGVFQGQALVAYQLWDAEPNVDFERSRFPALSKLLDEGGALFNKNTVVASEHQKRGLARRLEEYTLEQAHNVGWRRRFAQIFHDNYQAVRLFLTVDRSIVGLSTDEFGLNFVTATLLAGEEHRIEKGTCRVRDLVHLGSVLANERCFAARGRGADMLLVHGEVRETGPAV